MRKLPVEFYSRTDVVQIARELLGKILVSKLDGKLTSGIIVETEAYIGLTDKASHSFGGRRTARNEHMYAAPGTAYVYICYGLHHLFNVVTNDINIPDAVLIRAVEPLEGIDTMLERTRKKVADSTLTKGPGNVGKALGIIKAHSGISLLGNKIFIGEMDRLHDGLKPSDALTGSSKRIGIEGAGLPAADYLYRFYIRGNKFVSGYPNK